MIHKKLFKSIVIISVGLLLFTGCGRKEEPVISEAVETGNGENGDTVDATLGTGDTSGDVVAQQKPEEQGDPNSNVGGTGQFDMDEDEAQQQIAETEGTIEDAGYEIIPMDATTYYATQSANLRNGPGTQYEKVGSLSYAQEIICSGYVEDGEKLWLVLATEDPTNPQMVSASLVSQTKPVQQSQPQQQQPQQQQPSGGGGSTDPEDGGQYEIGEELPWGGTFMGEVDTSDWGHTGQVWQ